MMELTLREDKEIIENIYPEYQRGFMNARYDKQVGGEGREGGRGILVLFVSCGILGKAHACPAIRCKLQEKKKK